ncbi:pseudouridine synthase [Bulleidia sp. zg-1006]|uniref:pseudouridine synthase n=1 Tax=Bulleidia sp. zg-1006 TaxID=2806552 RepID=UPI00193A5A68|nr:pseudouridine synthase [Bulleidia sp. zg-1006]QRG87276.1 rRNA pseudouridine synthase [Bulleidia sp. zg-1006]
MQRLQKVIAQAGIASRRKAEELIAQGKVKVNGKVVREMGLQVSAEDEIIVNGQSIQKEERVYFLLNKPKKMISTVHDDLKRATIMDCFPNVKQRIFPVGRLDYETTGLLLVTNDGEFANAMMHPRNQMEKTYEVFVDGYLEDSMLAKLKAGVPLEDGITLPAKVEVLSRSRKTNKTRIHLTIQEGRNREIRRMMAYFGVDIHTLKRIAYSFLDLGNLRQGEYRRLKSFEVKKLLNSAACKR